MGIKSKIFGTLIVLFPKEVVIIFVAALPIFELRLAVPLGILHFKMSYLEVYLLSLLGNLLPVIPLLLFFKYFFHRLENMKVVGRFFRWWFRSVERRSKIVERWGFWGLACFVAIPLPITGAWTGTAAATLFEIDVKKAFLAISMGVAMAGVIMTTLSLVAGEAIKAWFTFT